MHIYFSNSDYSFILEITIILYTITDFTNYLLKVCEHYLTKTRIVTRLKK